MKLKQLAPILAVIVVSLLLFGCATQTTNNPNATASAQASVQASIQASIQPTTQGGDDTMTAQNGDTVSVDYVGTLDDGTVFDTSIKEEAVKAGLPLRPSYSPLEFTVGAGQMIAGFDKGVVGMKVGEEKNVHLAPSEAYGEKRADAVISVPIANVPSGVKVGSQLTASNGAPGIVIEVNATHVKIDFNHELAGKALNFKIIMRKITKK